MSDEKVPQIEIANEGTPNPAFDFGKGELAARVRELKEEIGIKRAAEDVQSEPGRPEGPITGAGIDWSEFDLDPNIAHLYPEARVVETPQGPKWVANLDEFLIREKNANPPTGDVRRNEKTGEASDMSNFVNEMLVMAPDGGCGPWKLVAFLPGSMTGMVQVIFQRKKAVALPDPALLATEDDAAVVNPADEELAEIEANAANWAGDAPPEEPYTSGAVEGADAASE